MVGDLTVGKVTAVPGEVKLALGTGRDRLHILMEAGEVNAGRALHRCYVLRPVHERIDNAMGRTERTSLQLLGVDRSNGMTGDRESRLASPFAAAGDFEDRAGRLAGDRL